CRGCRSLILRLEGRMAVLDGGSEQGDSQTPHQHQPVRQTIYFANRPPESVSLLLEELRRPWQTAGSFCSLTTCSRSPCGHSGNWNPGGDAGISWGGGTSSRGTTPKTTARPFRRAQ